MTRDEIGTGIEAMQVQVMLASPWERWAALKSLPDVSHPIWSPDSLTVALAVSSCLAVQSPHPALDYMWRSLLYGCPATKTLLFVQIFNEESKDGTSSSIFESQYRDTWDSTAISNNSYKCPHNFRIVQHLVNIWILDLKSICAWEQPLSTSRRPQGEW